jgi:hypothetical protein
MRLVALLILGSLFSAAQADAFPVHRRLFQVKYGGSVRCEVCHQGGGGSRRNVYGDAWSKSGETLEGFAAIEAADSDGDGFANKAEIEGKSNPGDPNSTPSNPGARYQRVQAVPIPTEQLLMVFERASSIEASELTLDPKQVGKIEKAVGRKLTDEDKLPTLYFALEGQKRAAVAAFTDVASKGGRMTLLVGVGGAGEVNGLALLRAGNDEPAIYRPYLDCLKGAKLGKIPGPGEGGCPNVPGKANEQKALKSAVALTLETLGAVYGKGS